VLVTLSCRKKEYPETIIENEPEFYFRATVNNQPVDFKAGIDGYQMYSSYEIDQSGVYRLIGELRKNDCVMNCPASLKIRINNYTITPAGEPVNIDLAVTTKAYQLLTPGQKIAFQSSFNKNAQGYFWDFGDGSSSIEANPVHTYSKPGRYHTCLRVQDNNSCTSTICNEIKTGYENKKCMTSIAVTGISDSLITFSQNTTGGTAPYSYLWTFGDGTTANFSGGAHIYRYHGSYPVWLRVIDANHDTATANYNAVTKRDLSSCAANFKVTSVADDPTLLQEFSKIIITWVDENGTVYASNGGLQPTDSFFEVLSVTGYENNENNELTRKIHAKFKCSVYNGANKITIDNAEATITVAYK
jgi:PKD repeat protein